MKMLNGNVCCINLDEVLEETGTKKKILVATNKKNYKRLKIVNAGELELPFGATIYAPKNSGYEVKVEDLEYTIINAGEIILILD